MPHRLTIGKAALDHLSRNPSEIVEGKINGSRYRAGIVIPDYARNIGSHFASVGADDLDAICRRTLIPFEFSTFGLFFEFDRPIDLAIHAEDMTLDEDLRFMLARFGPVIIRNAHLPRDGQKESQRNIFPHLNFHFDRGANQPTQYSLFIRDPFDSVQAQPRLSSTVFVANIVAHLQYAKERGIQPHAGKKRSRYDVFLDEPMDDVLGRIVLEHAWDRPVGTGEISLLHNRTVLHASYYRIKDTKGYPIGVRYLK